MQAYEELVDPNRPGRRRMKKISGPSKSDESLLTATNGFRTLTVITSLVAGVALLFGIMAFVRDNQSVPNNISVDNLRAVNATIDATNITSVKSDSVMSSTLMSENGTVTNLESDTAEITNITSSTGTISSLESGEATVGQLNTTTLTSENTTTTTLSSTDGTITNLASTMHTQEHLEYTASGALQGTHNVHILNGASALEMTLPADLTPLIGKHLKICSVGGQEDSVTLMGGTNTFDAAGFWQVVRFEGGSPCCIDLHVLSASSLHVISNTCTLFCATPTMNHCIDPERPDETNALHGYYTHYTKISFAEELFPNQLGIGVPLIFLDMRTNPPTLRGWRGTTNAVREPTFSDGGPAERPMYVFDATTVLTEDTNNVVDDDLLPNALKLQSDGETLLFQNARETVGYLLSRSLFKKIQASEIPPIIPATTGKLGDGRDPDDPVAIFKNTVDAQIRNANPPFAPAAMDEKYIGTPAALALRDEIINSGVTFTTPALKIFKTQNSTYPITRIRTNVPHHVVPYTRVTVSGCTGGWAVMNGEHLTNAAQTSSYPRVDANFQDFAPNDANRTTHFDVTIWFDSNALSAGADGVGTSTGPCEVSVSYGPLTSATEYLETTAAFQYWFEEAVGVGQHSTYTVLIDPASKTPGDLGTAKPRETWQQVQADYAAGTESIVNVRTRFNGVASTFYSNEALFNYLVTIFDAQSIDQYRTWDLNNRFGLKPLEDFTVSGPLWYNIPRQNYVVDVKVPYYRCTGSSKTHPDNLFAAFIYGQPGCDSFESILVNYTDLPSTDYHFYNAEAPLNAGSPFGSDYATLSAEDLDLWKSLMHVGRINPAYTGGQSIGYFRVGDFLFDDFFGFSVQSEFAPPEDTGSYRSTREAKAKIISTIFKYMVTDLAVEHIIMDHRSNLGGFADGVITLREFVGADETILDGSLAAVADSGNAPLVNTSAFDYVSQLPLEQSERVAPSLSESFYPGSVFTGGEYIFMTNYLAASAGDLSPNMYLGPAFDKDIGNGVNVQIFGDLDGRLAGSACDGNSIASSSNGARLRDVSGNPLSPTLNDRFDCDYEVVTRSDGTFRHNRNPALQPDCAPSLTGLSGGCALPNDEETLLYPDLGYVPNPRPRLVGDARPQTPTPANRDEWRDAWLEQAIEAALLAKKKKKKHAPTNTVKKGGVRRPVRSAREIYKRDVTCPPGMNVVPMNTVNGTIPITYKRSLDARTTRRAQMQAKKQGARIMKHEMETGGLCMNGDGHIMVTPTCQGLPKLVIS